MGFVERNFSLNNPGKFWNVCKIFVVVTMKLSEPDWKEMEKFVTQQSDA